MGVDFMNQLAPPTPEGFLKIHVYFVKAVCLWDIFWFEILPYNRSTLKTYYNWFERGRGKLPPPTYPLQLAFLRLASPPCRRPRRISV